MNKSLKINMLEEFPYTLKRVFFEFTWLFLPYWDDLNTK